MFGNIHGAFRSKQSNNIVNTKIFHTVANKKQDTLFFHLKLL